MAKLRTLTDYIGFPRNKRLSVCQDLLGFTAGRPPLGLFPNRPAARVSMNAFVRNMRQSHIHVRVIVAGSDLLTANEREIVDYAVFRLRDIYTNAGIGIGLILRQDLTAANSKGHTVVTSKEGAEKAGAELTNDHAFITTSGHTADGDRTALPVVIPADLRIKTTQPDGTVKFTLGRSPTPGPCSNPGAGKMQSSVIGISGENTGRTLAHEIGHFLGVSHPSPADNSLMTQSDDVTVDPFVAVAINTGDKQKMLGHCKILPGLIRVA
ncbi:hypothetical protein ACWESM_07810 [Nocardia sp. NPDC003999]